MEILIDNNSAYILTVLCGSSDNLVEKQFYASVVHTNDGDVLHCNGFISARKRTGRFFPWLRLVKGSFLIRRYECGYVYWNGKHYDNFVIDVKSVFKIPDAPEGFDPKFTLIELDNEISSRPEWYLDDYLSTSESQEEAEYQYLLACISYVKSIRQYEKTIVDNRDGCDCRI